MSQPNFYLCNCSISARASSRATCQSVAVYCMTAVLVFQTAVAALILHHAFMVACCFLAAFVLLLNFEYIDIHLVSDICVSYVHVLHLPSPPGDPSAVSDGPKDCWQKSLIVRALGLTPKGTPKLGNCTRGLKVVGYLQQRLLCWQFEWSGLPPEESLVHLKCSLIVFSLII